MRTFLEEVIVKVCQEHDRLDNLVFVLPSKRSGTFLQSALAKTTQRTIFAPDILSIERFIENVSGLDTASHTQQLFELYAVYNEIVTEKKSSFYAFAKWANILLQDFNEIDRHLVEVKNIFSNLMDIQEISHWSPDSEKTQMMEDYLQFWNLLEPIYQAFTKRLLDKGVGHQGLVYRQAYEKLENYIDDTGDKCHVFIGFNALNKSETFIIQRMISDPKNKIYWDVDNYFLKDPIHDAGHFIREYLNKWGYFQKNKIQGISNHFSSPKNIRIIGVPKNISQAKVVGNLLGQQEKATTENLENTAVILGDESLLNPILNSIPKSIQNVNITMGYPLNKTSLASLFEQFMNLYIDKEDRGWYHSKLLGFFSHSYLQILLTHYKSNYAQSISKTITSQNMSFVQAKHLIEICPSQKENLALLFSDETPLPTHFLSKCLQLINALRLKLELTQNHLDLEYLYRFNKLFNQLYDLVQEYPFVNDLKALQSLYHELLAYETLDFKGEPLEGLQVMGMLESRNLDFETVILTSVNEGVLPAGKSNNSIIPIDLKKSFGLPTFKEKDAVYTYHFYRLFQRAKNVYLLYNTEPDTLEGGEKSRLIMQLLSDKNKIGEITQTICSPKIIPFKRELETINKEGSLLDLIKTHASDGFSPSSLTNYIRNPIEFYKRNILKIEDLLEVEENVAANTLGTIVHDTLEKIYTPFIGQFLEEDKLKAVKSKIPHYVKAEFQNSYAGGDFNNGKNLIAFNVIVKFIETFIDFEIKETKNHRIKILGLEEKLQINMSIPELGFPVVLKGKLDRIDEKDGLVRIIDYKTGKVESRNVEIVDWQDIISDYKYSKAFQLLCYAFMYNTKNSSQEIESGIVSFKNLQAGLLKFGTKTKKGSRAPSETKITQGTLDDFQKQLIDLILEICNPQIPFTEKEV